MKVKLVFQDWIDPRDKTLSNGQEHAVYNKFTLGNLHSGTIFNADIELDIQDVETILEAITYGLRPSFYVIEDQAHKG
jgi:hypothetical protein